MFIPWRSAVRPPRKPWRRSAGHKTLVNKKSSAVCFLVYIEMLYYGWSLRQAKLFKFAWIHHASRGQTRPMAMGQAVTMSWNNLRLLLPCTQVFVLDIKAMIYPANLQKVSPALMLVRLLLAWFIVGPGWDLVIACWSFLWHTSISTTMMFL